MLYQVVEGNKNIFNAGSKATADVAAFAKDLGFEPVYVHPIEPQKSIINKIVNQTTYFSEWAKIYNQIEEDSILLLQHPFRNTQYNRETVIRGLKMKKNVKVISLIHDIEELRNSVYNDHYRNEFAFMLDVADQIIVHNAKMEAWLINKGVSKDRIIRLEVFDYLSDSPINEKSFACSAIIAGNLDASKSSYLAEIHKVKGLNFDLFGVNYKDNGYENICYHGAFKPEELSSQFKKGFGLVWDGTSINTCDGNTGNYLRYNNPHKLSLYVSSGVPVLIWKEAALADYIHENHLGITVDSLDDAGEKISTLTEEEYQKLCVNVDQEANKLRHGFYTRKALTEAVDRIKRS